MRENVEERREINDKFDIAYVNMRHNYQMINLKSGN